jgi:hypothetical protein
LCLLPLGWCLNKNAFFFVYLGQAKCASWVRSRVQKNVKGKLKAMKSHDYHIVFQQIILVCMRHIMIQTPRVAIL